jgi:hypothetical protein
MARFIYIRVSTLDQNPNRQLDAATALGISSERIFLDKQSGKDTKRPELQRLMSTVQRGDAVIVESISRFARNTRDLLDLVEQLTAQGNDVNGQLGKQGGYSGAIFFSYDSVTDVEGTDSIDKGTDGGGCIEIYPNVSDAKKRNEYLATFDGTPFSSGSHKVVGTLVIRTSSYLEQMTK